MEKVALLVRLEAKPGKEKEVSEECPAACAGRGIYCKMVRAPNRTYHLWHLR